MALSPPHHMQIYKPLRCSRQYNSASFRLFSQLPREIRFYIWELALGSRERFLKIKLSRQTRTKIVCQEPSSLGSRNRVQLSKEYQVTLQGRKLIPKLRHVCKDAQDACSKIYRIEMPCLYEHHDQVADGTLYLNPELDILYVQANLEMSFMRFAADVRDRDPKVTGIVNLAMDLNGVNSLDIYDELERQALTGILSKLKNVYFVCLESTGRMFLGPLNGVEAIRGWEMHRSRPIMGAVPSFRRVGRDPRPIADHLRRVFMGTCDPRQMFALWQKLLRKCGIEPRTNMECRFVVACGARNIVDCTSAEDYLQLEDKTWLQGLNAWEQRLGSNGGVCYESAEQLEQAPQTAIGFWVFPIEAIGEMPPIESSMEAVKGLLRPKRVEDLTRYKPELALMDL